MNAILIGTILVCSVIVRKELGALLGVVKEKEYIDINEFKLEYMKKFI